MPRAFSQAEAERIGARLLEVAAEHLPRTGFRKTSVDALVRAAGISKGSFYLFFESKAALWMALLATAEQQLRAELLALVADRTLAPELCLKALLRRLFEAVEQHPLLCALADPQDMAWLLRALPPGALEEARADDRRFFEQLRLQLRARGAIGEAVSGRVFAALPAAALALAQGRALIGEDDYAALVAFQVEAWSARLLI